MPEEEETTAKLKEESKVMKKALITGANGMLAKAVRERFKIKKEFMNLLK